MDQNATTDFENIRRLSDPFFSPDGEWVAFFSFLSGLKKVPAKGGAVLTIVETDLNPEFGGSWGPDNIIVFATGAGLFRVSADGGVPELIAKPDSQKGELYYAWPHILPGGRWTLFAILPQDSTRGAQIALLNLETLEPRILFREGNKPKYLESGHLVYVAGQTLEARAFDLDSLEILGAPVSLNTTVATALPYASPCFDLSPGGNLAYIPANPENDAPVLVWVDRQGREELLSSVRQPFNYPRLSPDGSKVALDVVNEANRDIYYLDTRQPEELHRVTFDPKPDGMPQWTPDGHHLVFASERDGVFNLYRQPVDGSSAPVRLFESSRRQMGGAFLPGSTELFVGYDGPGGTADIGILSLAEPRQFKPLLHSQFREQNATISPNGRYLAYQSDETGSTEIHVRPFPDVNRERWTISSGGGLQPRWARDNKELFYFDQQTGNMMTAGVRLDSEFQFEKPRVLFTNKGYRLGGSVSYDVSPKDGRFLIPKNPERGTVPITIEVVINWTEEIKRLVRSQ
jgi:serine/threonine-protein kinase